MKKIKNNEGSALITCLWVLILLILLVVGISYRQRIILKIAESHLNKVVNREAAEIGVLAAKRVILADGAAFDSCLDMWYNSPELFKEYTVGSVWFTLINSLDESLYGVSDEQSRLNLNYIDNEQLEKYFRIKGLPYKCFSKIVDYEEEVKEKLPAEGEIFNSLDELKDIGGFSNEEFEIFKESVTVYGDGKININTALEDTLLSLGFSNSFVDLRKEYFAGDDKQRYTEDDCFFNSISDVGANLDLDRDDASLLAHMAPVLKVNTGCFRVDSIGSCEGSDSCCRIVAVLKRQQSGVDIVYKKTQNVLLEEI